MPQSTIPSVVWFKRDLRIVDHAALSAAVDHGALVGLYIVEPELWAAPEASAVQYYFVYESLVGLRSAMSRLGGRLLVRVGEATAVLNELHDALRFDKLHSHQETGLGVTYNRDRRVNRWCQERDVLWREHPQSGVIRGLKTRDGWAKRWLAYAAADIEPTPGAVSPSAGAASVVDGDIPTIAELNDRLGLRWSVPTDAPWPKGGADEAHGLLNSFLYERGEDYTRAMSSPVDGWDACSRLSPHFAHGTLSVRQAYHAARIRAAELKGRRGEAPKRWRSAVASFEKRLRWRDHFTQKLEDEPALEFRNLHRAYDGMRTEDPADWTPEEAERFAAFVRGRTGYPMVDACMRCLAMTGWINFRMRAMLVSFASYHLWLHWKPVGEELARRFVDFEAGIHYPQCQMQSGTTGINTVRIYSPIKQAIDQDPTGVFIRRWIPELASVPDEFVHRPETMPPLTQRMCGVTVGNLAERADYPSPIVDHAEAVRAAKAKVFAVRGRAESRAEAKRVYMKHGSRRRPTPRKRMANEPPR